MSSVGCVDLPATAFLSTIAVFITCMRLIHLTQHNVSIGQSQREGVFATKLNAQLTPQSYPEQCEVRENPPASPNKNRIQLFCRARHRHALQNRISPRL